MVGVADRPREPLAFQELLIIENQRDLVLRIFGIEHCNPGSLEAGKNACNRHPGRVDPVAQPKQGK